MSEVQAAIDKVHDLVERGVIDQQEYATLTAGLTSTQPSMTKGAIYNRALRAQRKLEAGYDPAVDRRVHQRAGESDEDYAKRLHRNASWVAWSNNNKQGIVKPKKTPPEKLAKKAAYRAARRAALKQQQQQAEERRAQP